ncbi:MAG: zinc ribbon domain-containing protein [bacterium]
MGYTIQCAKCGHQNVLGRIFCTNCGQKLDFDQISAKPRRQRSWPSVGKTVKMGVTLVIIGLLVMILKPAKPTGMPGTLQDAQRMNQKLRAMKAAILDEKPVVHEVSEKEVNGYLAEILKRRDETPTTGVKNPVKMRVINVHFSPERIHAVIHVAIGPITLSYSVVGQPARKDHQFTIKPDSVKLGFLPLPSVAGDWIAGRLAAMFSKLGNEKALLDQVSNMQLGDGQVIVAFQGVQ